MRTPDHDFLAPILVLMSEHPYLPGKALVLSRLPAKDWFTLDESAQYSGWSRSYMRDRIKDGSIAAQEFQKPEKARAKGKGTHCTYRIHIDDLVVFIMKNGRDRFSEEKPFRDVVSIIRSWPTWMIRELHKAIGRILPAQAARTDDGSCGENQS